MIVVFPNHTHLLFLMDNHENKVANVILYSYVSKYNSFMLWGNLEPASDGHCHTDMLEYMLDYGTVLHKWNGSKIIIDFY